MDELEISGKRYISTRRAAKDHKYSSDYIGQLIRGKKVIGQKVGRSWYVDAESLANYLDEEKGMPTSKKDTKAEVREVEVVKEVIKKEEPKIIIAKKIEPVHEEEKEEIVLRPIIQEEKEIAADPEVTHVKLNIASRKHSSEENAYRIPIEMRRDAKEKKGLVYLHDDEPSFPMQERKKRNSLVLDTEHASAVATLHEERIEDTQIIPSRSEKKNNSLVRSAVVVAVGLAVLFTVTGASALINAKLVFEEGRGFTRQFSL